MCYFCRLPHEALTVFLVCADVKHNISGIPVRTFAEKHRLLLSRIVYSENKHVD